MSVLIEELKSENQYLHKDKESLVSFMMGKSHFVKHLKIAYDHKHLF